jgi:hypothetical protein
LAETANLHNSLWRQGTVLPRKLLPPGTLPNDLNPAARLVIVSHDCDLVHPSYEGEPYVEFFVAHPVDKSDGRKRRGKNPRRMQFIAANNGVEQIYEINVHDKFRVSRRFLEGDTPDTSCTISRHEVTTIGRWAAKRYSRPGFPSEFDRRLNTIGKDKFERAMQKYGDDVSGIFIAFLSPSGELPETEPYAVSVRVVAPREALADDKREQVLVKLIAQLQSLFSQCTGIQLEDMTLDTEADFSLEDWKRSMLWDYEYISGEESTHTYLSGS